MPKPRRWVPNPPDTEAARMEQDILQFDREIEELTLEAHELGIAPERLHELRKWDFHPQNHYSLETRQALTRFQIAYQDLRKTGNFHRGEGYDRALDAQGKWSQLARLRKEETGTPWYLTPEEYARIKG